MADQQAYSRVERRRLRNSGNMGGKPMTHVKAARGGWCIVFHRIRILHLLLFLHHNNLGS